MDSEHINIKIIEIIRQSIVKIEPCDKNFLISETIYYNLETMDVIYAFQINTSIHF